MTLYREVQHSQETQFLISLSIFDEKSAVCIVIGICAIVWMVREFFPCCCCCCCCLYPLMWTELQQQMVLAEQSPYGSNVKATDEANSWVVCFDEVTFSIWSLFQTSASTGTITKTGQIKWINSDQYCWESNRIYCNQTVSTGGQRSQWLTWLGRLEQLVANKPNDWDDWDYFLMTGTTGSQ